VFVFGRRTRSPLHQIAVLALPYSSGPDALGPDAGQLAWLAALGTFRSLVGRLRAAAAAAATAAAAGEEPDGPSELAILGAHTWSAVFSPWIWLAASPSTGGGADFAESLAGLAAAAAPEHRAGLPMGPAELIRLAWLETGWLYARWATLTPSRLAHHLGTAWTRGELQRWASQHPRWASEVIPVPGAAPGAYLEAHLQEWVFDQLPPPCDALGQALGTVAASLATMARRLTNSWPPAACAVGMFSIPQLPPPGHAASGLQGP